MPDLILPPGDALVVTHDAYPLNWYGMLRISREFWSRLAVVDDRGANGTLNRAYR